ncbi:MAG: leucyl aminopeptidase [Pseudohongiellaceae bacterium]
MTLKYQLQSTDALNKTTDCLVVGVWSKGGLTGTASAVESSAEKLVSKTLRAGDIKGKPGETLMLHAPAGLKAKRLLLVGCGEAKSFTPAAYIKSVRAAMKVLLASNAKNAIVTLPELAVQERDAEWSVTQLARECSVQSYRYDRTKSSKADAPALKTLYVAAGSARKSLQDALRFGASTGAGMNTARELGNLPGNICTPTYLAQQASRLGTRHKTLKTQVLGEKQMQKLGMGSLLSVAAGSREEARLVVIEYKGTTKKDSKPVVLVGKGITFDTGGISLKAGAGMDEMKFDMCGAASVIGTMEAVAELELPINVVAVIAAAENMPSGTATKPGDVVTTMAGKTVEILNTDAEGRLVLCDALTYVERFNPRVVIDMATLTGAAVATFADVTSALLANDQKLADALLEAGQHAQDPAWQLPLWDEYQPLLDSNFADIANIGGPRAGTITAACFLSRFTEKYPWAHLDIAGTAWNSGASKGATGRPVPLLLEYLRRQKA